MASTASAAMAATPVGEQPLDFLLQPLFLHGVSAATHLILAVTVVGRLLFRRRLPISAGHAKDRDVGDELAGRGVAGFRCYAVVAVCTTWAVAAFQLVLAAYSWYADAGAAGWSRDAIAERGDAAVRAVAWLLLAAYLQLGFGRRRRHQETLITLWWALFLLLSVVAVGIHVAARLDGLPVPGRSWAHDAVSVVAAVVLLLAGFLGSRDRRGGNSSAEEPLLIGAREAAADDNSSSSAAGTSSLLTGAGFLSVLTFSWMAPLLAVGHATLVLDDVPGLEPGDSVAGLLPRFKANLEALTGDGDTSGRNNVVTAFRLTKALLRTVWWHFLTPSKW
jgi:hypothetical protein